MISREIYIEKVRIFIDKPVVKVITGMRRSGKSVILKLLREELLQRNIPPERILYLNFESLETAYLQNADALHDFVLNITRQHFATKLPAQTGRFYIMLDEIQLIDRWERAIASFRVDLDCDIYITGSNSSLLSADAATLLAGRYVEIRIHPLSFAEHLVFTAAMDEDAGKDLNRQFADYLRCGGLPGIHEMNINTDAVIPYLLDVYNSVLLKDVISRRKIRDTELLERTICFLMDNIGNIFSAKRISDFLKSQNRRLSTETIYNYLDALESSFLIRKVSRWDIKGKRILETHEKYFFEDFGIKNALLGYSKDSISGLLENVVFLELLRRGYDIYVGQGADCEIDFIARRRDETAYFQVTYLLASPETIEREFSPLLDIRDNFPKYVLSMDEFDFSRQGIIHRNIRDWLLDKMSIGNSFS
ncbi:MAG: ATP-binding protein [Treponema sp.]|jgi:predicted AAA+ superfamily ATPase|nr:ATP-binding protein [Treponema sp.]